MRKRKPIAALRTGISAPPPLADNTTPARAPGELARVGECNCHELRALLSFLTERLAAGRQKRVCQQAPSVLRVPTSNVR